MKKDVSVSIEYKDKAEEEEDWKTQVSWGSNECKIEKIQILGEASTSTRVDSSQIGFQCNNSTFKNRFGRKECDIVFLPESKLKWNNSFNPKLVFSAF